MRVRRIGIVATAAALLTGMPLSADAAPVTTATTPAPAADTAGVASTYWGVLGVFYRGATDAHLYGNFGGGSGGGWGTATDYGGVLTAGVGAVNLGSEFAQTWMFVRGTPGTVYYRMFSDGSSVVGPWTNLGGPPTTPPTQGTPAVSSADGANPIVYVRGGDNHLWQRTLGSTTGWQDNGGTLTSDATAVPATEGVAPAAQDVFVAGANGAVYEYAGRWYPAIPNAAVRTASAPAALRFADGGTWLFYRAQTTNHLMRITRRPGQAWSAPLDLGGTLTAAPAVTFHNGAARVVARLADGNLYQGLFVNGQWAYYPIP